MALLQIDDSRIIGTDFIVETTYYDGSPVVALIGQPTPPDITKAKLEIELSSGTKIELNGESAAAVWDELAKLAEQADTVQPRPVSYAFLDFQKKELGGE